MVTLLQVNNSDQMNSRGVKKIGQLLKIILITHPTILTFAYYSSASHFILLYLNPLPHFLPANGNTPTQPITPQNPLYLAIACFIIISSVITQLFWVAVLCLSKRYYYQIKKRALIFYLYLFSFILNISILVVSSLSLTAILACPFTKNLLNEQYWAINDQYSNQIIILGNLKVLLILNVVISLVTSIGFIIRIRNIAEHLNLKEMKGIGRLSGLNANLQVTNNQK